jgi:hypothetical protein
MDPGSWDQILYGDDKQNKKCQLEVTGTHKFSPWQLFGEVTRGDLFGHIRAL